MTLITPSSSYSGQRFRSPAALDHAEGEALNGGPQNLFLPASFSVSYALPLKDFTLVFHVETLSFTLAHCQHHTTAGCHTLTPNSLPLTDTDTAVPDTRTYRHLHGIHENTAQDVTNGNGHSD